MLLDEIRKVLKIEEPKCECVIIEGEKENKEQLRKEVLELLNCEPKLAFATTEKELLIKKWIESNIGVISEETSCYSIDDVIERLNSVSKLEKALDKACLELVKMCEQAKCKDCHFVKEQTNCLNDCPVKGNLTYLDWKGWCLK